MSASKQSKQEASAMAPAAVTEKAASAGKTFFGNHEIGLLAETLANDILDQHPAALTAENAVALYENGFYSVNGAAFNAAVRRRLRDRHRPNHVKTAELSCQALLYEQDAHLPTYAAEALLNCPNTMVDLATGQPKDHDPSFMSANQIAVEWDPDATCPKYKRWCIDVGLVVKRDPDDEHETQWWDTSVLDGLEEAASQMLDESSTPERAIFLFGPSRSGKGTFLRILEAVVGKRNTSAVTLHELTEDRFAAADLYGSMLNSANDISSRDVKDLELFKKLTGDDTVSGQRKFERRFDFRNKALFAFSANSVPTVSERSTAYQNRIHPVLFGTSFEGHEDRRREAELMEELPGILVRLVAAWQRRQVHGYRPASEDARTKFAEDSNRVLRWFRQTCEVVEIDDKLAGATEPHVKKGSTLREMHRSFNTWADSNEEQRLGQKSFAEGVEGLAECRRVRFGPTRTRGYNVMINPFD